MINNDTLIRLYVIKLMIIHGNTNRSTKFVDHIIYMEFKILLKFKIQLHNYRYHQKNLKDIIQQPTVLK